MKDSVSKDSVRHNRLPFNLRHMTCLRLKLEKIWSIQLHPSRDTPAEPVVDSLHPTGALVVAKQNSQPCRAAKPLNKLTIIHAVIKPNERPRSQLFV